MPLRVSTSTLSTGLSLFFFLSSSPSFCPFYSFQVGSHYIAYIESTFAPSSLRSIDGPWTLTFPVSDSWMLGRLIDLLPLPCIYTHPLTFVPLWADEARRPSPHAISLVLGFATFGHLRNKFLFIINYPIFYVSTTLTGRKWSDIRSFTSGWVFLRTFKKHSLLLFWRKTS